MKSRHRRSLRPGRALRALGALVFVCGVAATQTTDVTLTYTYDALGRLTHVHYGDGTTLEYAYDVAGNIVRREVTTPEVLFPGIIDFDAAGELPGMNLATTRARDGDLEMGPVAVNALLPSRPGVNSAVLFDSAGPTGGDFDLGTPNETFGGPGIGAAGAAGQPFENREQLGNLLIVAESLADSDGDGLVDEPDDAREPNMLVTLDFAGITTPWLPGEITVAGIRTVDLELDPVPPMVRFYGAGDLLLGTASLLPAGDNGARYQPLGNISGVRWMQIELHQSCAIAEVHFVARP